MVVNNQMMDQLLVNTAAQAPQTPNASKPKDAQNPDFDSMVNQRRSADAKPNAKDAKAEKPEKIAGTEETKEPVQVTDEQYAIAAAMMMQAQTIPPEMVTAEDTVETETVLTVDTGEQPDMPELTLDTPAQDTVSDMPVAADTQAEPETPELPKEDDAPVQQKAETVGETRTDRPVEAKPQTQEPQRKPDEPQAQPQAVREDVPRTEDAPEQQPRFVRTETKPQTEDETAVTDDAQTAQAAPLFRNVEAPVVKVAEASRPIPLETEDGVEQLAREIDTIVVNDVSANRIEVTLTPENLGKLTVEITRGEDGNLSIVLHTTTERAANLLEKHTANLQNALASNNRENVEVQVKPSGEPEQQFLNPDGRNEQNRQQQQQQQHSRREQTNAQDFLQQLRLGLVESGNDQ